MSVEPMSQEHVSVSRAVRHHLVLVIVFLVLGGVAGWFYGANEAATYTSTTRVLVNPAVGNPFVPTPTSVRQDEVTSLETEAQVARSEEVLGVVAEKHPQLTVRELARGLQITVPPNTQILEISYTAADPSSAQAVADEIATTFLANRVRRFDEVNQTQIDQVRSQTDSVISDLRDATEAAAQGTSAEQLFQSQLANALRNELVSLRAQRTALENSEAPPGTVISPATLPVGGTALVARAAPLAGAILGLLIGCLLAVLVERRSGVIRSAADVEELGLNVAGAVPPRGWADRRLRRRRAGDLDTTIRRMRGLILEHDPRPDVVTVTPAGSGESDSHITEAVAESFARAGHRVVLVRVDEDPTGNGLVVEDGLAQALLHERLNVLDLLQPTVEPLLCVLPSGGFTAQSREFLIGTRVRSVLAPLVEAGNLVVIQAPGIDSADGEAMIGAADLSLVVVTTDVTRRSEVEHVARRVVTQGAALVVGKSDTARRVGLATVNPEAETGSAKKSEKRLARNRR